MEILKAALSENRAAFCTLEVVLLSFGHAVLQHTVKQARKKADLGKVKIREAHHGPGRQAGSNGHDKLLSAAAFRGNFSCLRLYHFQGVKSMLIWHKSLSVFQFAIYIVHRQTQSNFIPHLSKCVL